ncbi:hypothetical protein [Kitasatospora sp. NPDC085879]|uniref:hypothetical protein n=1 Tax=Kitasatospora sp. NPDC085879 TaxID=3154769 RepID=UPI00342E0C28
MEQAVDVPVDQCGIERGVVVHDAEELSRECGEVLAHVARVLGLQVRFEELTGDRTAEALRGIGHLPEMLVPSVLEALGPDTAVLPVTGDVERLTGHPARTFRQWVHDNADRF